jgi:hypothetical protein
VVPEDLGNWKKATIIPILKKNTNPRLYSIIGPSF